MLLPTSTAFTAAQPVRVLNLYAGLGGNRKNWSGVYVTAVEKDPRIAAVYGRLHPQDKLIVGDAHEYLLENFENFDFVWSSPPCQTHSKMNVATRHKTRRFADLKLYEEILLLKHFFKGKWCVENVRPYYEPLIKPTATEGRHAYWSNFEIPKCGEPTPAGFIKLANLAGKHALMDWLGIHYEENIYIKGNHCPAQILRNCVHPNEGEAIFRAAFPSAAQLKLPWVAT